MQFTKSKTYMHLDYYVLINLIPITILIPGPNLQPFNFNTYIFCMSKVFAISISFSQSMQLETYFMHSEKRIWIHVKTDIVIFLFKAVPRGCSHTILCWLWQCNYRGLGTILYVTNRRPLCHWTWGRTWGHTMRWHSSSHLAASQNPNCTPGHNVLLLWKASKRSFTCKHHR